MKVEFHPSTASDVGEGALFYRRARTGLESEFRHEIDAAVDRIANNPLLYPLVEAQMVFHGKWYDEVQVGDSFGTRVTVTETHIVLGSGMFGDFNPLHVDEEFSKKLMFGGRILHGPFTSALVSAAVGNFFAGTAIAYLEHSCRFKAPVRAGDTLATRWTVTAKADKPKHKGGIIELKGQATNQRSDVAVECEGKIPVASVIT